MFEKNDTQILSVMPHEIKLDIERALKENDDIHEILFRCDLPIILVSSRGTFFLHRGGSLSHLASDAVIAKRIWVEDIFQRLCHYSVYAYQEQVRECYLTLPNGARIGISGEGVCKDGRIQSLKSVYSLCFRMIKPVQTAAKKVLDVLKAWNFPSALIIGAPCSGKTTLLREMCRLLSSGYDGKYEKCTVIDVRGEIAALHKGVRGFDVGINTDILSGFPKQEGMTDAVRALSPKWIIADEIGELREARSICEGFNSGVRFLLTMHAGNVSEAKQKPQFQLLQNAGSIGALVVLGADERPGQVKEVVRL